MTYHDFSSQQLHSNSFCHVTTANNKQICSQEKAILTLTHCKNCTQRTSPHSWVTAKMVKHLDAERTVSTAEHLNLRVLNCVFFYNFHWTNRVNVNRLHLRLVRDWSLGIAFSEWPTIPCTPSTLTDSHWKGGGRKRPWLRNPPA